MRKYPRIEIVNLFLFLSGIQKKIFRTEEIADIAINLNDVASIYLKTGNLQKALEINEKAYSKYNECL